VPQGRAGRSRLAKYLSNEFFQELAGRLAADGQFQARAKGLKTSMMFTVEDQQKTFLLTLEDGRVHAQEGQPDAPAEFKFAAPYVHWVAAAKGEADLQSLVLQGKLKFKGSLTKILYYADRLMAIADALKSMPKEF
jgi:alkyl sulfatase BDS1-like metallo-beta-lactamase superfamily hydrolase